MAEIVLAQIFRYIQWLRERHLMSKESCETAKSAEGTKEVAEAPLANGVR